MDAVTYPDPGVINFVHQNIIPLRVPFDAKPLSSDFNIKWTPSLLTLDTEGKEHHRTLGFLGPEELIPSLLLGIAKVKFDQDQFAEALTLLERILAEFPKSTPAPEAIFIRGVSRYKQSHEAHHLKEAYEKLTAEYPDQDWTKRAYPYRLL